MNELTKGVGRNDGIDSLRMLSMLMVVILHLLWQGGVLLSALAVYLVCSGVELLRLRLFRLLRVSEMCRSGWGTAVPRLDFRPSWHTVRLWACPG